MKNFHLENQDSEPRQKLRLKAEVAKGRKSELKLSLDAECYGP